MWRGTANAGDERAYVDFLYRVVLPELEALPGSLGARVLRRTGEAARDFVVLTYWADMDAVRAFSGADVGVAVVPPEARALLSDFDEQVEHFEVVAHGEVDAGQ